MPSIINIIAEWACGRAEFSEIAHQRAKHAIADTIGCIVAGAGDEATIAVRKAFAADFSDKTKSAVVGGGTAPAAIAALVNGASAHALDFDDNFGPALSHASAVLVPALLAVGQEMGASGRDFASAYIVGLEAQAGIGAGVNPSHYLAGWHATSTVGTIGTAAAVARLMGLDARGVAGAMSVATSMASGIKGQFGTPAKPLHAGLAARNAVEAARLAASGLSGRHDILEGPQGFLELFGGGAAPGWKDLQPGQPLAIESDGLLPKRHPCCAATHSTVDAILDLKSEFGFTAAEVASVVTVVGTANARNLPYSGPEDEMQARFSMQYCVALALSQQHLRLSDFTREAIGRPEIRRLLPLTTMKVHPAEVELGLKRMPHQDVTVCLKDGRELKTSRGMPKGNIAEPFDDADRLEKFIDCCSAHFEEEQSKALYSGLQAIDAASDLGFLTAAFTPRGR